MSSEQSDHEGVRLYHTAAQGLRTRAAAPLAARARARRHARFFPLTGADQRTRILDVGCGELGLRALDPSLDVTGVDLVPRPHYPGPFLEADAAARLPFADSEFDLAYSSSVIEHIEPGAARERFARELRRVARGWFVQTPAYSFPLEPHALLPGAHWLPPAARRRYWRLGVSGDWEQIALLRRREMVHLFGEPLVAERAGPLVKSWISVRVPSVR
ncbi:MAG: class I SAM-dependent methyltransferase [Solirubrobacteraceae bacterium]